MNLTWRTANRHTPRLSRVIRIRHWWMFHGRDTLRTAAGVAFFVAAYLVFGTLDYMDEQREQIKALETSGRAHSAALAALLNGRAIVGNGGTWAARCENVVSN